MKAKKFDTRYTDDMHKQVMATIDLIERHIIPLNRVQQAELQPVLKRLVQACLSLAVTPLQEEEATL